MKRLFLLSFFSVALFCEQGFSMAVIDSSNLAQNIVAAREAITHTQNQIQTLTNQLNQYKRMLQDAMNPGQWTWGDVQETLNQLKNSMNTLKSISGQAGGVNAYLDVYGTYDSYDGSHYGGDSQNLFRGDYEGSQFQKESADDLLKLIEEQQKAMDNYSDELERLKGAASGAEGQQAAIQHGNELASMQIQLLSQIHLLLMAQNTMLAAQVETETNREAQQRVGTAIKMGETSFTKKETSRGGQSFKPYK